MIQPELLPHYTISDYRQWQGDWELIDGIPYAMAPSPTVTHQRIGLKIARQLDELLEKCTSCLALYETDWIVCENTVVCPDVMVICGNIEGDYPTHPPKIIFEIISPSTAVQDERLKFELYREEGVTSYILVYPEDKVAKLFELKDGQYVKVIETATGEYEFVLEENCRFTFDFSRIWP